MKKPMLVIAATATVSAIMSTVSRPARRARTKLRVAKRQALIERILLVSRRAPVYANTRIV
jgi:hypothetical protein